MIAFHNNVSSTCKGDKTFCRMMADVDVTRYIAIFPS